MNCRDYTAEFEERRALSAAAQAHLNDCPDCGKMSSEQTRIWDMIEALERIDAPNTFDFRVKARIAAAKPSDFQPRLIPVLRYVLPLSVIVLLLGLFAFNSNYFSSGDAAPQMAAVSQFQNEREDGSINSLPNNQSVVANTYDSATVSNAAPRIEVINDERKIEYLPVKAAPKSTLNRPKNSVRKDEDGGSSRVLSVTTASERLPAGITVDKKNELPPGANAQPATDEQILDFYGIVIVSEKGSRKVQTVKPNTQAERAGVKAGDFIEAIDGEKLSAEPIRTKTFAFKRLTLLRGTEKIEITLQK